MSQTTDTNIVTIDRAEVDPDRTRPRSISKILIANRGEIAARIIRTAREMDIRSVALYSDPDRDLPYVSDADEAVHLPGTTPAETYLRADLVIAAAQATNADAIHPGYGFLSENEEFARTCLDRGIIFIGPSPEAIAAMGSKVRAKEIMSAAGVPVLPGTVVDQPVDGTDTDDRKELDTRLHAAVQQIGLPILVKAAFGGGGRGMRIVHRADELGEAVRSAQREAASAFGNGMVFLEKFVESPRHIEVQIFGDACGRVYALGERECSIQRRYQKIVEEAPSTAVTPRIRERLASAAISAGAAIDYRGAGTVEFVMAPDGEFYFLEVNTRLQVEHPVTELVTGTDLVRAQLLVAAGLELPEAVTSAQLSGHAIEVRLYAEDAAAGFVPDSGRLVTFDIPDFPGVRIDGGFRAGNTVSTFYDPMLAKIIAFGEDRAQACDRLARVLDEARIHGVKTNKDLLTAILREPQFRSGAIDTGYLDRHGVAELSATVNHPDATVIHAVAAAIAGQARRRVHAPALATIPSGFRTVRSAPQVADYRVGDDTIRVEYEVRTDVVAVSVDGAALGSVVADVVDAETVDLAVHGVRRRIRLVTDGDATYVDSSLGSTRLIEVERFPDPSAANEAGSLLAPMPGSVVRVEVTEGQTVTSGAPIVVMEAMKMEHTVAAPGDGTVSKLLVSIGDQVDTGAVLAVVTGEDDE